MTMDVRLNNEIGRTRDSEQSNTLKGIVSLIPVKQVFKGYQLFEKFLPLEDYQSEGYMEGKPTLEGCQAETSVVAFYVKDSKKYVYEYVRFYIGRAFPIIKTQSLLYEVKPGVEFSAVESLYKEKGFSPLIKQTYSRF